MQQSFTFAGHESTEWDVCITGANTFQGAMKSVGKISIPGRNGDLYLTNKKYENVSLVYPCYIAKNFDENIEGLTPLMGMQGWKTLIIRMSTGWLHSPVRYCRQCRG